MSSRGFCLKVFHFYVLNLKPSQGPVIDPWSTDWTNWNLHSITFLAWLYQKLLSLSLTTLYLRWSTDQTFDNKFLNNLWWWVYISFRSEMFSNKRQKNFKQSNIQDCSKVQHYMYRVIWPCNLKHQLEVWPRGKLIAFVDGVYIFSWHIWWKEG